MVKVKAKRTKKKKSLLQPIFPKIVVQRINKHGKTRGGIIDRRMDQEETPYAIVYETGSNEDFKRGELVMIHAHVGHDFKFKTVDKSGKEVSVSLTIIEPEDVIARVEGTPKELDKFIDNAKYEL